MLFILVYLLGGGATNSEQDQDEDFINLLFPYYLIVMNYFLSLFYVYSILTVAIYYFLFIKN